MQGAHAKLTHPLGGEGPAVRFPVRVEDRTRRRSALGEIAKLADLNAVYPSWEACNLPRNL